MGEHKRKKPGEIKGDAYKQAQREPLHGKYFVAVTKLAPRWLARQREKARRAQGMPKEIGVKNEF